ncbi:hypothetical protein Angca_006676, partial [Angiostrongylus cantonensis]
REPIKEVCCGRVHTVLLTVSGEIFVSGSGSYGQLGIEEDVKKQYGFRPLPLDHDIKAGFVKIATGFYHSIAIAEDGRLFEWGLNPQEVKMRMFVIRRLHMAKMKRLAEGDGEEMALDYQLGHGNKTDVICSGGSHTIAVAKDGRTFGWGKNDFAQCGVPSDKTPSLARKYFYQPPKDGSPKRCVSLSDDFCYVVKPTLIPEVNIRPHDEDSISSTFDQKQLMMLLRGSGLPTIQAVSRHFLSHHMDSTTTSPGYSNINSSIPIALVHLMAGNVLPAIEQIGRARSAGVETEISPALRAIAGLAWEVVANHEDCQSRSILSAAFKCLPITNTQKRNSQLRRLWPMVWDEPGVQDTLSAEEKLNILEGWIPPTKCVTSVEIPAAALRSFSNNSVSRIRVWARCRHVEPAVVGVPASECNTCAEEWAETVRTTL